MTYSDAVLCCDVNLNQKIVDWKKARDDQVRAAGIRVYERVRLEDVL